MDNAVRLLVRQRAESCCEYCRLRQSDTPFRTFHIDHIRPRKHGGSDDASNLALACDRCSLHKGYNLTGIDNETNEIIPLFNPRSQTWDDHFRYEGVRIIRNHPHRARYCRCMRNELSAALAPSIRVTSWELI
jgi:hypothetical protein